MTKCWYCASDLHKTKDGYVCINAKCISYGVER